MPARATTWGSLGLGIHYTCCSSKRRTGTGRHTNRAQGRAAASLAEACAHPAPPARCSRDPPCQATPERPASPARFQAPRPRPTFLLWMGPEGARAARSGCMHHACQAAPPRRAMQQQYLCAPTASPSPACHCSRAPLHASAPPCRSRGTRHAAAPAVASPPDSSPSSAAWQQPNPFHTAVAGCPIQRPSALQAPHAPATPRHAAHGAAPQHGAPGVCRQQQPGWRG